MSKLPVVAAIPNYNMAAELAELLPLLISQGYRNIFVLDDASTDNSREVVEQFGHEVIFVSGTENRGAGGNRNRILEALDYDALIHFMDADTRLETVNTATIIQSVVPETDFGFLGGLAKTRDGFQQIWNYGPRPGFRSDIAGVHQDKFGKLLQANGDQAAAFRARHAAALEDWPNPLVPAARRETYWCIEQNIVFCSDIFKHFGGFDESLRETEISELSLRMHRAGLKAYFDPSFSIIHTEGKVRTYNRLLRKRRESTRLAWQYGILKWLQA